MAKNKKTVKTEGVEVTQDMIDYMRDTPGIDKLHVDATGGFHKRIFPQVAKDEKTGKESPTGKMVCGGTLKVIVATLTREEIEAAAVEIEKTSDEK